MKLAKTSRPLSTARRGEGRGTKRDRRRAGGGYREKAFEF
jgi:hypothetical protein